MSSITNRLTERMSDLKGKHKKAFIAYLMSGDPDWEATGQIIQSLERVGVTAVELGVPFSDPIADGPVIQEAAERALANGVTLKGIFQQVRRFRKHTALPILLMGYWNVFLQHGREKTLEDAREAGIDGFIVADLPPEADTDFFTSAKKLGLCTVLLAAELTSDTRLKRIAETSTGFVYYVPQLGITGLDLSITQAIKKRIRKLKAMTETPVCVGIGIKTREEAQKLCEVADGVIVGTRIVQYIHEHRSESDIASVVQGFVTSIMPD
jgi:tryptophan synthase alpha chain